MTDKKNNADKISSDIQDKEIMLKAAELLVFEGLLTPAEKARLFMYIREESGV